MCLFLLSCYGLSPGTHQTAVTDFQKVRELLHPLPAPQAPAGKQTNADGDDGGGGGGGDDADDDDNDVDDTEKSRCGCQTSITHKYFSEAMLLKMVETMETHKGHNKRYVNLIVF